MLNITVIYWDDSLVEYEWESKKAFIIDMESDNENIPRLDGVVVKLDTKDTTLINWYAHTKEVSVYELLKECKYEEYLVKHHKKDDMVTKKNIM